jgi:hypothetical protein
MAGHQAATGRYTSIGDINEPLIAGDSVYFSGGLSGAGAKILSRYSYIRSNLIINIIKLFKISLLIYRMASKQEIKDLLVIRIKQLS